MYLSLGLRSPLTFNVAQGVVQSTPFLFWRKEYDIYKFTDKAEDEKLKNLITTEEPSGTGQNVTGSSVFQRNADYLNELSQQNSDCIGWLKVSGCGIDYPVMYCKEDPEFYLHANFDKEYSGIGTPYVDGFCTPLGDKRSDNVIIYGHNISSGEMFECKGLK